MPIGLSPRNRPGAVQSSPGRRPCSCASSWASACAEARGRRTPAGPARPARRAAPALIELSIRCAAAARAASRSTSSSVFCGFSGKNSPCLRHELGRTAAVGVLPRGVVRRAGRSGRRASPGSARRPRASRSASPASSLEALVEHLPAEQVPDLLVGLAGVRRSASRTRSSSRTAPPVSAGSASSCISRKRASSESSRAERVALGLQRLAQQLADLLQGAVEAVVALQLRPRAARSRG